MSVNKPHDLQKVLSDTRSGVFRVSGVGGILAELLRRIWADSGISLNALEKLIEDFARKARESVDNRTVASYMNKSNLRRELSSPKITWRSFIKALRILHVTNVEFCVKLTYKDGRTETVHKVMADLGQFGHGDGDEESAED